MFNAGFGKHLFKIDTESIHTYSWGVNSQTSSTENQELTSRCICLKSKDKTFFLVNLEIHHISENLSLRLFEQLKILKVLDSRDQLLLTANGTFSGPAGYDSFPLFNITSAGQYDDQLVDLLVESSVNAALSAHDDLKKATLYYKKGQFDIDTPIAFQTDLKSFLSNKENHELEGVTNREAVQSSMQLIHIVREEDEGFVCWYSVQCRSLGNMFSQISSDNRGLAARLSEKNVELAIFAQAESADIRPDNQWNKKRGEFQGPFNNPIKNREFHGRHQYEKAMELLLSTGKVLEGDLLFNFRYHDFSKVRVSKKLVNEVNPTISEEQITSEAVLGVHFFSEHNSKAMKVLQKLVMFSQALIYCFRSFLRPSSFKKWRRETLNHWPKDHFIKTSRKELFFGILEKGFFRKLRKYSKNLDLYLKQCKALRSEKSNWVQNVLPQHLIQIGPLLLIGSSFNPTVSAGKKIRKKCLIRGKNHNPSLEEVIFISHSNSYGGVLTTYSEYRRNTFLTALTLFGKWSLVAYMTYLELMVDGLYREKTESSSEHISTRVLPLDFSDQELESRVRTLE
jgi:hypothetical protein